MYFHPHPENTFSTKIPIAEFNSFLHKHAFSLARYGLATLTVLERWGDEYVATFLRLSRYYQKNARIPHMNHEMWITYLRYVFDVNYPLATALMEKWSFRREMPHESVFRSVFSKYRTLANPQVRTFLETPQYNMIIASYTAKCGIANLDTPSIRLCKGGNVAKNVASAHWSILAFWCHIGTRVRAWRISYSLRTSIPYTPKEPLDLLVLRNPIHVPNASYAFGTTIHRDAETYLQLTFYFNKHKYDIMRWVKFLANQDTANGHRVMNKVWRVSSQSNMAWYFAFANVLAESPVSHNRLLYSVLHKSLQLPAQFALEMSHLFWKCMRTPKVRPQVISKLLYISCLRNSWQAGGHHAFSELMWTFAIQANIRHECVCKELLYYLGDHMVVQLGRTLRDDMQQSLWESKVIQKQYNTLLSNATARVEKFLERVPALWRAKQVRKHRHIAAIHTVMHSSPLRTFAIRSSYTWRKLQKTPCPICMIEGVPMVPLHMDMRHAICKECRTAVKNTKNTCPLCRIPLVNTSTCRNLVEYEYDEYNSYYDDNLYEYEDPDYDDDQWYHYD